MSWQEEYKKKLISAEEAASKVKSGDRVAFTAGREALAVGLALFSRAGDVNDVKVFAPTPGYDFGWYDAGFEQSFQITVGMPTAVVQDVIDERRCDVNFQGLIPLMDVGEFEAPDVLLTEVSPPDQKGYCSFGASLWNKKERISRSKISIAEVNKNLIRTYGDNYIHVSEIDYFVEHTSSGDTLGSGSLAGRTIKKPEPYLKTIAGYVNSLIRNGDCLQIGVGRTTEPLAGLGLLDGKEDIGYHSEATPPGIIGLVKAGVINGKRKNINPGKVVVSSIGGSTREEMNWVDGNPVFYLVTIDYLEDPRIISCHDNMVAINNALSVDLLGQISAETIGTQIMSLAGGQIAFVIGAWLSKGGRAITVLPSAAKNGTVSRIVPRMLPNTAITIQRNLADTIVTEYGVARLRGKTVRQRAQELISVAHPDFRSDLKKEADRLFG